MFKSNFEREEAGVRPATLLKRDPGTMCFPVNFAKFLRTPPVAASERGMMSKKLLYS